MSICDRVLDEDAQAGVQEHTLSFAAIDCHCYRVHRQKKHFDNMQDVKGLVYSKQKGSSIDKNKSV